MTEELTRVLRELDAEAVLLGKLIDATVLILEVLKNPVVFLDEDGRMHRSDV